jgi:hypothetical protein
MEMIAGMLFENEGRLRPRSADIMAVVLPDQFRETGLFGLIQ